MSVKPTLDDARWGELADGTPAANIEAPSSSLRNTGWPRGQVQESKYENYMRREAYKWFKVANEALPTRTLWINEALGNGSTNGTSAVQAVFNTAQTLGYGTEVVFPDGVFMLDEVTSSSSGIRIRGSGKTILRRANAGAANGAILRILGDDTAVENLRLESGGIANRYLLRANIDTPTTHIRNLSIEKVDCVCDHRTARGIFVGYYDGLRIERCYLENLLAEDDPVTDASTSGIVLFAGTSQVSLDAMVLFNRMKGWYRAIESCGNGLRHAILLKGNRIREARHFGIYNYGGAQAQISVNYIEDCFAGIYADSSSEDGSTVVGNHIDGNTVRGCETVGIVSEEHQSASISFNTCVENQDGIILGGGTANASAVGNVCTHNTRYGIWADKAQTPVQTHLFELILSANICKLNGEDGIRIGGVKRSITLGGNVCTDNGTSGPDIANPYAGIRIGFSTDGATASIVSVAGGAYGNNINPLAGTGGIGKQGTGVLVEGGSSTTLLRVYGALFAGHGVANIDSGGVPCSEWGNDYIDGVNDLVGSTMRSFGVGGQVLLPDGTVAAPALAFASDPDTGLRRSGANAMPLVSAGIDQASVTAGGLEVGVAAATARLVVGSGVRIVPETIKTADYAVSTTDTMVIMDGTSLTATLPASPATNQAVFIRNQNSGSALTVARNGQNINGAASDLSIPASSALMLSHVTGSGWYVMST